MLVNLTDVDLRMLRIFCSIVDAGGFTAAQVPLNTSLSRLSVLVRDLEVRLGYSLCKRGKSGFQLTAEGEETYAAAQELFSNIGHFRQRTAVLSGRHRDLLRIGTVDSLLTLEHSPVPAAIARLRAVQPGVHIDLQVMRPDELEQAVLEERIQAAIGAFHHRLSGLHYQALFEEEQHLYCGSGHPFFLRPDQDLTFEELSTADYVDRGYVAGKQTTLRASVCERGQCLFHGSDRVADTVGYLYRLSADPLCGELGRLRQASIDHAAAVGISFCLSLHYPPGSGAKEHREPVSRCSHCTCAAPFVVDLDKAHSHDQRLQVLVMAIDVMDDHSPQLIRWGAQHQR
ncbi:DNA-binding transcriptional LysR family regulator [Pseudomonas baetica]|nr:DNA-binding transcriptional LysR family regulator [Pseudomonas baetica]